MTEYSVPKQDKVFPKYAILVEPLADYRLKGQFRNNEIKIFDMKSLLQKNIFYK